ncbi:MAG: ankyrin repeat domain-containing protein [Pseudomonadota bacterium]
MALSLETLRKRAKTLRRDFAAGSTEAIKRVQAVMPDIQALKHTDALHVIARELDFASWPKLKFAADAAQMTRETRIKRLEQALYFGQHWVVDALLAETPDLAVAHFGLACALYRLDHVAQILATDPSAATREIAGRRPIVHLAFSQHLHGGGDRDAMVAIAEALFDHGADANDLYHHGGDPNAPLSALYGALGHANNMRLSKMLLERGADPNDGESLYHATELGHREGLKLLLDHGAQPNGTNALPRALDFNDHAAVKFLLSAGADVNEEIAPHPSGEAPFVVTPLFQAIRRRCDAEMFELLLAAGADPYARHAGVSLYPFARACGHREAAAALLNAGSDTTLRQAETVLAAAADDALRPGMSVDPSDLPDFLRMLPHTLLGSTRDLGHISRLIDAGLEHDVPDEMGLPPVQIAGWEGLPDFVEYFLRRGVALTHRNEFGGDLLETIVHGSEFCPHRANRDHIACAEMALNAGFAVSAALVDEAGDEEMAAFLADRLETESAGDQTG